MKKYNVLLFLLDNELYEGNVSRIMKKYGIKETREVNCLVNELIDIGKPQATVMISIFSNSVVGGEIKRVYLPWDEVKSNTKWFAVANLLCELLCGEKVWSKSKFLIEKDGCSIEEWKKTELFEKRFKQMIEQLIKDYPSDHEKIETFSNKVYHLRDTITRSQYNTTELNSICGMLMFGLNKEAIQLRLDIKKNNQDWKMYANEEEFYCINDCERGRTIADTLGKNGVGFWMEISAVYCL